MPERTPKTNHRSKALPALLGFGVSLSMASGACTSTSEASAHAQNQEIFLAEEEVFDVSLATFYVFDKEHAAPTAQKLRLAAGCGAGCGCSCGCACAELFQPQPPQSPHSMQPRQHQKMKSPHELNRVRHHR
jgi:hypothetical protein